MSVGTYASEKEVDASSLGYHLFIVSTFGLQVSGVTVEDMNVLFRAVDMVEQVAGHERVVALGVLFGQSHVFVHVESEYVLKRNAPLAVGFHQFGIHSFGRRTGGKTQHKGLFGGGSGSVDALDNVIGGPT